MKYTHLALVLTSAIALAACGGSGDSDHTDSQHHNHNNHNNNHDRFSLSGVGNSGSYTVHHLGRRENDHEHPPAVLPVDANTIDIDGQIIPLLTDNNNFTQPFDIQRTAKSYKIIGTHLQHVRYGFLQGAEEGIDSIHYITLGEETQNMPATGVANYHGYAFYNTDDTHSKTGTAMLTADFSAKKLTGEISIDGISSIKLQADIYGNDFDGFSKNDHVSTNGSFYGDNAAEISGTYITADAAGAFGASKK